MILRFLFGCCDCAFRTAGSGCPVEVEPVDVSLSTDAPATEGGWSLAFEQSISGEAQVGVRLTNPSYTSALVRLRVDGEDEEVVVRGAVASEPGHAWLGSAWTAFDTADLDVGWALAVDGEGPVTARVALSASGGPCDADPMVTTW